MMSRNPDKSGKQGKSFTAFFTIAALATIVFISVIWSVIFFLNFQRMSHNQIEIGLREVVNVLKHDINSKFDEWQRIVMYTAFGAAPIMGREPVNKDELQSLLRRVADSQPSIQSIYTTSKVPWFEEGGFVIYHDDRDLRLEGWDNTQRPWFIKATEHSGQVVYTDPYVDHLTGHLTISVAKSVYTDDGRAVGVVSADVDIAFLTDTLQNYASMPNQRIYFLDREGFFITNPDTSAILTRNFFEDSFLHDYREQILNAGATSFFRMDANYFVYSVLIPHVDWILVSTVPTPIVLASMNHVLFRMIGLNMALVMIMLVISVTLVRILKRERDENNAMKNNHKVGFFLMDKNFIIQGQYAHVLEKILSSKNLRGKNFVELVSVSLSPKDINALKDYLEMVVNRSFDQDMLDDVNPIKELAYKSIESGEEKALSCGFTAVDRGSNNVFILGNIIDITTEKNIQRQLENEKSERQEEIYSMLELIQSDPNALDDLIEDTEYGLSQIDGIMKNDDMSLNDLIIGIYQSVHAIKSNAVIVGLKTFGNKLQSLESEIKTIRDNSNSSNKDKDHDSDLSCITPLIKRIKDEQRKLTTTINRIQSFKVVKREDDKDVLVEYLSKACTSISVDLHKEVRFSVKAFDPNAIEMAPKLAVKEILVQLIRNSIYHGIESREERIAKGKPEMGIITLSITMQNDKLRILLGDDGKGLDIEKIKAKIIEHELLLSYDINTALENDLMQAIFLPGFSTADGVDIHAGRGIGLNLVRERVLELKGDIKVHSKSDRGTIFTIFLPIIPQEHIIHSH